MAVRLRRVHAAYMTACGLELTAAECVEVAHRLVIRAGERSRPSDFADTDAARDSLADTDDLLAGIVLVGSTERRAA